MCSSNVEATETGTKPSSGQLSSAFCAALACVAGSPCRLVVDLATLKQLNQKTKPKAKGLKDGRGEGEGDGLKAEPD